jgi:RND family efflux transporter MFP subunit
LFLVGLAAAGCAGETDPPKPGEKPATVNRAVKETDLTVVTLSSEAEKRLAIATVEVERKAVTRNRLVGAEVMAPSGAAISITAPLAGTVQTGGLAPVAGAPVSAGQVLFRLVPIQPSERDAAVDAQQETETATARRDAAMLKAQRAERLVKDGAGSRRQFEEAQAELAIADAELKAARDRIVLVDRSGASQSGIAIEAPQTAIVQAIHVREGQTLSAGVPVLDLVRLDTVWIRVPVYAGESADIDKSAPAHVLALGEPSDAEGILARSIPAPPSANAATAGVDLYYAMANSGLNFRPGERVAVRLQRRGMNEGLVVPKSALLHDAYGGTWVYVASAPQLYTRYRVSVVDVAGPLAVLSAGPPAGARVVTDGAAELFGVEFGAGK